MSQTYNKNNHNSIVVFGGVFFFLSLLLFFYLFWKYHFLNIEQYQLFLFTQEYVKELLFDYGGLSSYLARFCVQFFIISFIGPALTALLLTAIGVLFYLSMRQSYVSKNLFVISFIPVLFLIPLHLDVNYKIEGTIALLLTFLCLFIYTRIKTPVLRILSGILFIFILFAGAGATVTLFIALMIPYELHKREKKAWIIVFPLLTWLISIWFLLKTGVKDSITNLLLPDTYYDPKLHNSSMYYPWIAFFILFVASLFLLKGKREVKQSSVKNYGFISLGICLLFVSFYVIRLSKDREYYNFQKQSYFVRNHQWQNVIANYTAPFALQNRLNPILNLALAKQGLLGEKLFERRPKGVQDLLPQWDSTIDDAVLLSEIYYHIGDIASSQKMAFEATVASINGGSGYMLLRLIETNIIFGNYAVAKKYISILEKTFYYKSSANELKRFLYSDNEVEKDTTLANKRKALVGNGNYAVSSKVVHTLEQLAINNPENQIAIQYLAAMCLLNKDRKSFRHLLELYYGTPVWPKLSTLHQEAVVTLERNNPTFWVKNGVSLKVEQNFRTFNEVAKTKQHTPSFEREMRAQFGDTYWLYLIFDN